MTKSTPSRNQYPPSYLLYHWPLNTSHANTTIKISELFYFFPPSIVIGFIITITAVSSYIIFKLMLMINNHIILESSTLMTIVQGSCTD